MLVTDLCLSVFICGNSIMPEAEFRFSRRSRFGTEYLCEIIQLPPHAPDNPRVLLE